MLGKIPRTGAMRSYVFDGHTFNYLIDKDLIFLCVGIQNTSSSEISGKFLSDFKGVFEKRYKGRGQGNDLELTKALRDLVGHYNAALGSGTKVQKMEKELDEVTEMMRDNIGRVIERGEKIESLVDKTNMLRSEAQSFRTAARNQNRWAMLQEMKGKQLGSELGSTCIGKCQFVNDM